MHMVVGLTPEETAIVIDIPIRGTANMVVIPDGTHAAAWPGRRRRGRGSEWRCGCVCVCGGVTVWGGDVSAWVWQCGSVWVWRWAIPDAGAGITRLTFPSMRNNTQQHATVTSTSTSTSNININSNSRKVK